MKTLMSEGERLRGLISRREFPTSRLTAELRASAVSYARRRVLEGASQGAISEELGVSTFSVSRWLRGGGEADFVPVRVVPDVVEAARGFEVVTPRGLRIVGLDIDALCALLERHG
jgi:DNA-binding transcriptional regulator LsrR (DeoR family)